MIRKFAFLMAILTCSTVAQNRGFGLGVIVGEPTGLSAKKWVSGSNAFQGAAAWSFGKNDALQVQLDFIMHRSNILPVPVYFGLGGVVVLADDIGLGARLPVGIDYPMKSAPLDIFLEIVPTLALTPSTEFVLNGGLGIRYWF